MNKTAKKFREIWLSKNGLRHKIKVLNSVIAKVIDSENLKNDYWKKAKSKCCPMIRTVALLQTTYNFLKEVDEWMIQESIDQEVNSENFDNWALNNARFRTLMDFSYTFSFIFSEIINISVSSDYDAIQNVQEEIMKICNKLNFLRKFLIHPTDVYISKKDFDQIYDDSVKPKLFLTNFIREDNRINLFLQKKNLKIFLGNKLRVDHAYLADNYVGLDWINDSNLEYDENFKYKIFIPVNGKLKLLFVSFTEDAIFEAFFVALSKGLPLLDVILNRTYLK